MDYIQTEDGGVIGIIWLVQQNFRLNMQVGVCGSPCNDVVLMAIQCESRMLIVQESLRYEAVTRL